LKIKGERERNKIFNLLEKKEEEDEKRCIMRRE
jgi:hypothetical protein